MSEHKASILCIDDEEMIRWTIGDYLEDSGYKVLMAENGKQGLKIFEENQIDIVLVDLRMPEMDGLEVLSGIRAKSPETPVIVISGAGLVQDVIEALRRGAWNYITKPIEDMTVLEFAVEQCLERSILIRKTKAYEENLENMVAKRTRELEEANNQLQQAQKMEAIGTLAGGIAHDFNNTLGAILGYTELTLFKLPKNSQFRYNLDQVLRACNRARDLVSRILTFSRKSDQKRIPVEVTSIIKECFRMLRSTLPASIEMRQSIAARTAIAIADPTQIHQVIMNLCTNAAHAMELKGGILEIGLRDTELATETPDSGVEPEPLLELFVRDNGHGIPADKLEKIFDPYFTTKAEGHGTGLGLSVVRNIAESHNGKIMVESRLGEGSVFRFFLPAGNTGNGYVKPESDERIPLGNEHILFVDDEPALVDVGKKMLEQLGYTVECTNDAEHALKAFQSKPDDFDLVITDLTMPNMKGDRLAEEITKTKPGIPILLSTGFNHIRIESGNEMGISAILTKPLRLGELAKIVRRVLDENKKAF